MYLSIKLVAGSDLREHLDGKPAKDVKTVCATLADVAEALAALHAQGVVHHRDRKPENIMLRADGAPVIVDFGIAHIKRGAEAGSVSRGSPEYFSPEQARSEPPTPPDDMYSFGIIIVGWINGQRPDVSLRPDPQIVLVWRGR